MAKEEFAVFNEHGVFIKKVRLDDTIPPGKSTSELLEYEKVLRRQGLYAHRASAINQEFLRGKSFKERLRCLCWRFDKDGKITGWGNE